MSLTDEQLSYLQQFGFDESLLDSWRKGVREGWYSKENNWLKTAILAPEADAVTQLPKRDSESRQRLTRLGLESMQRAELGVVILNGGMATRFGGIVKGTVSVLGERSFLALRMEDVKRSQKEAETPIPVYLMNSFATDAATQEHCVEHGNFGLLEGQLAHFTQFISLRMTPGGDLLRTDEGELSMYGPGHGDFSLAMKSSGLLDEFIDTGGKYLFVSNVDNLGARVSPLMLGQHIESAKEVTVELAPKWPGDVGGAPFMVDDRLQLIESIRFPKDFDPDITDVFNTNTFWFSATALQKETDLGWYFVEKEIDGKRAIQMEHLIGELTRTLDSNFVRVKRTGKENRFLPVKTPEDLDSARAEIEELYPKP